MAIVQISQIKHRRGTNENLPQLASAELGWSVDTRQLYIGNGTLAEGAPVVGNTEILTEFSDIPGVAKPYTQTITANTSGNLTYAYFDTTNPGIVMNYVVQRGSDIRTGALRISQFNNNLSYDEEYNETANIGFTFTVTTIGGTYAQVSATAANGAPFAGIDANLSYASSTFTF